MTQKKRGNSEREVFQNRFSKQNYLTAIHTSALPNVPKNHMQNVLCSTPMLLQLSISTG